VPTEQVRSQVTIATMTREQLKHQELSQQGKIKYLGLLEVIHYENVKSRAPDISPKAKIDRGTIATILLVDKDGDMVSRGIAIRCPQDTTFKLRSRVIARDRAIRAAQFKSDSEPIRPRAETANNIALSKMGKKFGYKSVYQHINIFHEVIVQTGEPR
jgi:hypothetical protein